MHICKMCVCMYACMYVCTSVYMCVCMYVCNTVGNSPWTVIRRSNSGAGEIFRTQPDRPGGPPILRYNRHPVSFPVLQWPWHPLLVPILSKGRATTLLSPCACSACYGTTFIFTYVIQSITPSLAHYQAHFFFRRRPPIHESTYKYVA